MGHEELGDALHLLLHEGIALLLKEDIADRERLIDNQNFRFEADHDRKGETGKHTARIGLDRLSHVLADVREVHDFLDFLLHLLVGEAAHGAVQEDVLIARVLRIKTGAELEQSGNFAPRLYAALARRDDTGDEL